MEKRLFTTIRPGVYEGILFQNQAFITHDPKIIAKLRRSSFYGGDIREFDIENEEGEPQEVNYKTGQVDPPVKPKETKEPEKTKEPELKEPKKTVFPTKGKE